jgi:predicted O-methyltransferase YrrM
VEVRVGAALELLPTLTAVAPFDFFFIDADKVNNPHYFQWSLQLARVGSVIVIDNVVRDGKVLDADSTDPSTQGVRTLNELIASTAGVQATTVQTVGSKGYDGFTLIVVTHSR